MQKIQVFLRADQKAALKSLAARTGKSRSALIRTGVDLLIERGAREGVDWRAATRAVAGLWKDRTDLNDLDRALRTAAKRRYALLCGRT